MQPDTATPLAQIVFILDRPQDVVNVGAVVRLMGNFGLARLRLVEPAAFDEGRILSVARRGAAVLHATEHHPSLDSALADCGLVLGATSRNRAQHRPVLTPRQAALALLAAGAPAVAGGSASPPSRFAAVLFGPEDFGLPNEALDRCHGLLRIPTVPHDASLNLAQAALLVAYELHLLAYPTTETAPAATTASPATQLLAALASAEPLASGDQLEQMFESLQQMLWALHPTNIGGRVQATMVRLRALLLRAVPRDDEALLLARVFNHVTHGFRPSRDGQDA